MILLLTPEDVYESRMSIIWIVGQTLYRGKRGTRGVDRLANLEWPIERFDGGAE